MKKYETTNTFNEGLMMDINPLVTPNNVITSCLNGTFLTHNGNENVLQNDMGNGRVETAFLPEGYVPLGTTSFGGIIYIVSYNPFNGKCQIGSFPSPERNFTKDELQQEGASDVIFSNDEYYIGTEENADKVFLKLRPLKTPLIKKLLGDTTLNPGDKYLVCGDTITKNLATISQYDNEENLINKYVDFRLATIDNNGRTIYLSDLQKYKGDRNNHVHIKEGEVSSNKEADLDDYRKIIGPDYNIFTSNIAGNLYIVGQLEVIDSLSSVTWEVEEITEEGPENVEKDDIIEVPPSSDYSDGETDGIGNNILYKSRYYKIHFEVEAESKRGNIMEGIRFAEPQEIIINPIDRNKIDTIITEYNDYKEIMATNEILNAMQQLQSLLSSCMENISTSISNIDTNIKTLSTSVNNIKLECNCSSGSSSGSQGGNNGNNQGGNNGDNSGNQGGNQGGNNTPNNPSNPDVTEKDPTYDENWESFNDAWLIPGHNKRWAQFNIDGYDPSNFGYEHYLTTQSLIKSKTIFVDAFGNVKYRTTNLDAEALLNTNTGEDGGIEFIYFQGTEKEKSWSKVHEIFERFLDSYSYDYNYKGYLNNLIESGELKVAKGKFFAKDEISGVDSYWSEEAIAAIDLSEIMQEQANELDKFAIGVIHVWYGNKNIYNGIEYYDTDMYLYNNFTYFKTVNNPDKNRMTPFYIRAEELSDDTGKLDPACTMITYARPKDITHSELNSLYPSDTVKISDVTYNNQTLTIKGNHSGLQSWNRKCYGIGYVVEQKIKHLYPYGAKESMFSDIYTDRYSNVCDKGYVPINEQGVPSELFNDTTYQGFEIDNDFTLTTSTINRSIEEGDYIRAYIITELNSDGSPEIRFDRAAGSCVYQLVDGQLIKVPDVPEPDESHKEDENSIHGWQYNQQNWFMDRYDPDIIGYAHSITAPYIDMNVGYIDVWGECRTRTAALDINKMTNPSNGEESGVEFIYFQGTPKENAWYKDHEIFSLGRQNAYRCGSGFNVYLQELINKGELKTARGKFVLDEDTGKVIPAIDLSDIVSEHNEDINKYAIGMIHLWYGKKNVFNGVEYYDTDMYIYNRSLGSFYIRAEEMSDGSGILNPVCSFISYGVSDSTDPALYTGCYPNNNVVRITNVSHQNYSLLISGVCSCPIVDNKKYYGLGYDIQENLSDIIGYGKKYDSNGSTYVNGSFIYNNIKDRGFIPLNDQGIEMGIFNNPSYEGKPLNDEFDLKIDTSLKPIPEGSYIRAYIIIYTTQTAGSDAVLLDVYETAAASNIYQMVNGELKVVKATQNSYQVNDNVQKPIAGGGIIVPGLSLANSTTTGSFVQNQDSNTYQTVYIDGQIIKAQVK